MGQLAAAFTQVLQAGSPDQHDRALAVLDQARRSLYQILADGPAPADADAANSGTESSVRRRTRGTVTAMADIEGWTADGFEGVRDAFAANFTDQAEVGAAFAAYHHGHKVVDLWGGVADPATERPWEEDSVALVFSTTKGATATCAHLLAQSGRLDVEAPVADYWPEFAAAGKESMPVAYLMSHQAGLAWTDAPMTLEQALAWDPVIEALAAEAPKWEPGTAHGYHATTYGWLVGEVVHRIDGRSLGTFFHDEVATPLGLDFWIGLPEEIEPRVAPLDHHRGAHRRTGPRADGPVHGSRHHAGQGPVRPGRRLRGRHRRRIRPVQLPGRRTPPRSPRPTASPTPAPWPACTRRW